ncbi:Ff.00g085590.m01.CDS01 [Fusarium sp. VM40]|nr:Ff.00g085590.m01.CDS01 [Fusarium sp. VM40]
MKFTQVFLGYLFASANAINPPSNNNKLPTHHGRAKCEQACTTLASEFPGRLHYKDSDSSFTIWDQKQLETRYICRVQPQSASEVSRILQVLVGNWCRFAVKCGGHSRFPDDSVSLGGVTIDLGLINNTIVSEDRKTARVGGGSLSRQVFASLDPYGLAYVGGRVGQVGIGGFTLGGGSSVLAAKYGWALDNVLEYEVVLANATIVTASENTHADLYYALRGGGNNFGIVTSFNVSVFPQGPLYTGSRTFGDNQTGLVLAEAEKIFAIQDYEDTSIGLEYRYTYTQQSGWSISTTQRYAEPVLYPQVFNTLNSIPALGSLAGGINSLANSTSGEAPLGVTRNVFATLTHYPSVELGKRGLHILKELVEGRNLTRLNPQLITYSIPAAVMKLSKVRGGNALGLNAEGHLIINLFSLSWTDSSMDEPAYSLAEDFIASFQEAAKSLNAFHPFIYINYANKGQDVFEGYGEANHKRLTEVQKALDPQGVFTSSGLWMGFFKVR